ncbi:MAG: hypothetical protein KA120_01580, partial [Candidatus Goldbacteria bacterium]|nr:hypothetical protein [Candidatus Goldiibacteriota bacterium]
MIKRNKKYYLILNVFIFFLAASLYSANMTSARLCGNFDDYAQVYVNGNLIGSYNYINWDSGSGITCITFSTSYLNASGSNVIAIKVQDTNGGEVWASWYMDVTYDNGQHAYNSSNDGGGKIASTYDCGTAPPNDGGGNSWTSPSYSLHSSWPGSVQVTATTWGKVFYDPSTGQRLRPYSYNASGSSSGHGCLYMRWGVTLTPEDPPPGPTFSITKTASKTTDITTDSITFTLRICNTGGYTTSRVYILDQWSTNEFGYDATNSAGNQNSAYGPNFSNSGQQVTVDFPNGFEGNTCINVWFKVQDYYFDTSAENCQVRNNFASVYYGGSSRGSSTVTLRMRCVSPTPTPTRTRTPAPSPTQTRTLTPTPSRTLTQTWTRTRTLTPSPSPSPSRTPTPTYSRTPSPTPSRTPTPSPSPTYSRTPTPSPTRTPTPSYSRTPTPSPSPTYSRTPTPSPTRTPTPSPSRTPTPTYSRTPSPTPSPTPTPSPSWTTTPSYSRTPTTSPTRTPTPSPSRTPT